ncbi:DUF2946 domain-containing protein [Rhodoferax sp. GW822-FHT02A01]|uniref:DUF2946 domain-containing protein n=1 Tax=Rhodoferax sp. GW822-FHT02A01 TaxID=3141537 RepID=UPI00315DFA87
MALSLALRFARYVLVWFVLSVGVSVASPFVAPRLLTLVCTSAGAQVIEQGQSAPSTSSATWDCPACVNFIGPVASFSIHLPAAVPYQPSLPMRLEIHTKPVSAAPPPSRAPPASLST